MRSLETGRFIEFEALDDLGLRRGLVLAEIIGIKELLSNSEVVVVVEPVAAEEVSVLQWAKTHLSAPAAIYICPGADRAAYADIGAEEDCVIMLVMRARQLTSAAAEISWAGPALALHRAAAERDRPPRRASVAPPAALELDGDAMGDSDEDVLRAASSRSGDGLRLGGSTTMGAVDDLRRRVRRDRERPPAGNASSRGAGHGPATSRITGDGRSRIAGDRRRVSLAPPPLLGGADDVCGNMKGLGPPAWPPAPLLPPGASSLFPLGYGGSPPGAETWH